MKVWRSEDVFNNENLLEFIVLEEEGEDKWKNHWVNLGPAG